MKNYFKLVALALVAFALNLTSCGGVDQSDPRSVADAAVKMYQDDDYKGLITIVNPDNTGRIKMLEQYQNIADEAKASGRAVEKNKKDYKFEKIIDRSNPNDKTVEYSYYDPEYQGGFTFSFRVNLENVDGKWYLDSFN